MPELTTSHELLKGLTDLPLAIAALLLYILADRKHAVRREWRWVFLLLSLSAAMGVAAHCFILPQRMNDILWLVLFAVMFELVRAFSHSVVNHLRREDRRELLFVRILELVFYLLADAITLTVHAHGIYSFVFFCALLIVRMFVCALRCSELPRRILRIIGVLFAGLVMQAIKSVFPLGVTIGHLIVLIALIMVYKLACDEALETAEL